MNAERPYEIDHVPPRLRADFGSRVPPAKKGDADERDRNFLSRALAAYAVHKLTGCPLDDAAKAVVDAGQDGGIDAVYHSPTANALWVAQSKFFADGKGEPALGDVSKFRDGIENLTRGNWEAFEKNEHWSAILPAVKRHMADPSLKVQAVLVYSGIHAVSQDRLWMFEELSRRLNQTGDNFEFKWYGLTSVHDWIPSTAA